MERMIMAVDPGREKCGIAVVHEQQGVLQHEVVPTVRLAPVVEELLVKYQLSKIVLGDGTSSREAKGKLEQLLVNGEGVAVILVDERHSTDQARKRYWREHPPTGFMRLIPVTMQVPPKPVDDYVAVILAERYLGEI